MILLNVRISCDDFAAGRLGVVSNSDWLIGRDRRSEGADRIYTAAAELMAREGYDAFSIDALAAMVHCSPATIYRHVGGKAAIRDAVLTRQAEQILDSVRAAIAGLTGSERIITATTVALESLRVDPLARVMRSLPGPPGTDWLTESPVVARFAAEMVGADNPDPLAAQWLIRVFMALWLWPFKDGDAERAAVRRYLGPPYLNPG